MEVLRKNQIDITQYITQYITDIHPILKNPHGSGP